MSINPVSALPGDNAGAQSISPSSEAQVSGQALEDEIEAGFRARGIEIIKSSQWDEARLYRQPNLTAVVLDAPYISIFGHRARIEFLLLYEGRQILIEAKRQRVAGSTDEKLPYVFANARANIESGRDFILVLEGDGWKPGALRWITNRAKETDGFSVLRRQEFFHWLDGLSENQ